MAKSQFLVSRCVMSSKLAEHDQGADQDLLVLLTVFAVTTYTKVA